MVIRTPDHHLRVFVSSTLKELAEERKAVRQAIVKLRLAPVMFEAGARPHPAQELYKSYLSQSQVFIGIYWKSYGWVAPDAHISGLEDEYNLSAEMPRLIYIKNPTPDREPALTGLLDRIRNDNASSYTYFSSVSELKELVQNDLALLLTERFETVDHVEKPTQPTPVLPPTNVPIPRNQLIGRDKELALMCEVLDHDDTALITLTGAGGTGKSRLAIQIGQDMLGRYRDGVYLVRLEPIYDPELVIPTIAETFGLHESTGSPPVRQMLSQFLGDKQMLLILDNFEQVVEAATDVSELLEACPALKCIVTSRTPLHLRAEKEIPVPPLSVPGIQKPTTIEGLSQYAAVELFIQRAQAVKPDFAVTNASAPAVAEICYRLDGLPLAIELAAAKIKLFTPQMLLGRLENRFDLLKGGTRDLPERQRTLRGAIDWSYNLLTDQDRMLLRRLSVFIDGCTIEAAETVCDVDGDLAHQLDDALESLIDNNLVILLDVCMDEPRFGMLSTIHDYACERLLDSDESNRIHQQHAQFVLDFVANAEPRIRSSEREHWQLAMQNELGNIRGALEWVSKSHNCIDLGQKIVNAFGTYWHLGGYISEGRQWCERMLALCDADTSPEIRSGLLCYKGELVWAQGDQLHAAEILKDALPLCRMDNNPYLPLALLFSAKLASDARDLDRAADMFQQAYEILKKNNDLWFMAICLSWLGDVALYQDDPVRSQELREESLRVARLQGDPWSLVPPLMAAARLAIVQGDLDSAYGNLVEVVDLLHQSGDVWSLSWTILELAHVAIMHGDYDQARTHVIEGSLLAKSFGNRRASIIGLVQSAALIAIQYPDKEKNEQKHLLAAQLCGSTAPYIETPGVFMWSDSKKLYDDAVERAKSLVDPAVWDEGNSLGKSLPIDNAINLAIDNIREA